MGVPQWKLNPQIWQVIHLFIQFSNRFVIEKTVIDYLLNMVYFYF
jgi:hypothetical protein